MRLAILLLWSLVAVTGGAQQPKSVPVTTYTDTANGMTLQYPSVWERSMHSPGFSPPFVFEQARGVPEHTVPVRFGVVFTGKGNYYEHTSLEGLAFFYGTVSNSSADGCAKIAADVSDDGKTSRHVIHGVSFTLAEGSQGSTGHFISAVVHTVVRNGTCLIFEEDLDETAPGLVECSRPLSTAESKALDRHLDGIMESVRFAPQCPSSGLCRAWRSPPP